MSAPLNIVQLRNLPPKGLLATLDIVQLRNLRPAGLPSLSASSGGAARSLLARLPPSS